MTHAEQEEMLRRALHAVADAIEPAADGLERIRERLSRPRPLAVAWLMAGWTGLAQPVLLRMEPVLAELAGPPRRSSDLGALDVDRNPPALRVPCRARPGRRRKPR